MTEAELCRIRRESDGEVLTLFIILLVLAPIAIPLIIFVFTAWLIFEFLKLTFERPPKPRPVKGQEAVNHWINELEK